MLQSHAGEIHLMPALPSAWPDGSVTGLRARGGFTLDIAWKRGKLEAATLRSPLGRAAKIRYGETLIDLATDAAEAYRLDGALERM